MGINIKEIVLQIHLLNQHPCMEEIRLIHIDIHRVVSLQRFFLNIILDGRHIVIHKELAAVLRPRKSAHTVIHRDNIRIEGTD